MEYFPYWGKAKPKVNDSARYHLLVYHCLDVAACGQQLLTLPQCSLKALAQDLGWSLEQTERVFTFFLALHDLGKFARAFQGLVPDLSPDLVLPDPEKRYRYRHDTLGWLLWRDRLKDQLVDTQLPSPNHEFWDSWIKAVTGHHGRPPLEGEVGGMFSLRVKDFFCSEDQQAALKFVQEIADLLLPKDVSKPNREQRKVIRRYTWHLAGLAVLADWLGSNQQLFVYQTQPQPLADYWKAIQSTAQQAVDQSGLQVHPVRHWAYPERMFDYLHELTPLQRYATEVPLETGPQLFLLEDVTGAGKTEAALILAQRLMQAGAAQGLYFALPSMATANQMYQRLGQVYRKLYEPQARPSLILAHGARNLVDEFSQSIVQPSEAPLDRPYGFGESSATLQCNAWLADSRKKALLAEVGVGTVDQALLAVMPARHQSLRLLGLSGKVLLIDEVHAYDSYMMRLLRTLLKAHAQQGGSVLLLSATLPHNEREQLLEAYRSGLRLHESTCDIVPDQRYPLATQIGQQVAIHACATRPQLMRRVMVSPLHAEERVIELIQQQVAAGRSLCWIRNTVEDARRAYELLNALLPVEHLHLFHSRFVMADRLDIEDQVLNRFGKNSTAVQRQGQVLIGTQVLEQSLDFDVDVMVSDLAPIDLLIQRAGRLQRHNRDAQGNPADHESRTPPVLYLLCPEPVAEPAPNWYSSLFPKACFVYPNVGQLWLGARVLLEAGCIVSPGALGEPGAVRTLVEAVYGEEAEALIPDGLQNAYREQLGLDLAMDSQAAFNELKLEKGYCEDSSGRWYEDTQIPTRLGDETQTLYLAYWRDDALHPLKAEGQPHAWEQSAVRIDARKVTALALDWQQRFSTAIDELRHQYRLLEEPALIVPVEMQGEVFVGWVQNPQGQKLEAHYDERLGLLLLEE